MVRVVKSYSQIFLSVIIFGLCFQYPARAEQAANDTLAQKLKVARAQCAVQTYAAGNANAELIKCENAAVLALTKNQFDAAHQKLLDEFLNRRILIAQQFDHQNIDYADYSNDLADAADRYEEKIQALECTRSTSCSQ